MENPEYIFYFDKSKMTKEEKKELGKFLTLHMEKGGCTRVELKNVAKHFKIKPPVKDDYTPEFDELWSLWGKGGKRTAAKAYHAAMNRGYTHAQITAGIPHLLKEEKKRENSDGNSYRPLHLSTWLNGDRFLNVSVEEGEGQLDPFERTVQEIGWALSYKPTGAALVALRECVMDGLTIDMVQGEQRDIQGPNDFVALCYSIMNKHK